MPRCRRFWIPIAMLCGGARAAAAQPADSPITLGWDVPAGSECPSGEVVSAEVERLLGGKPSASTGRRLFAQAKVGREAADGQWKLTLRTVVAGTGEETDGERTLRAPSCEELGGAAALIVALGFDPAAVAAQAQRAALAPPDPAASARSAPAAPPAAQTAVRATVPPIALRAASRPPVAAAPVERPARVRFSLGVGAGADVGSFAAPAYAVQVSPSLRYRTWQLALTAAYLPPQRTPMRNRPAAGGSFSLITGGVSACGELVSWRAGFLGLGPCAGIEVGQMRAEAYGVRSPDKGDALWLAPRGGLALTAELPGAVALRLDVSVAVPVTQNAFFVKEAGVVHKPDFVCGRAGAGVEFHF